VSRIDRGRRMIWTTCGLSFIARQVRGRLATDFTGSNQQIRGGDVGIVML